MDLADIQFISKNNKGIRYLLSIIDIYSKYARVVALQNKIYNNYYSLSKNLVESKSEGAKPKKLWGDKGSKFCNRSVE